MTELRAKRVTHAQSPYITVGACKLFNSPAYLSRALAGEPFLSHLSDFPFPPACRFARTSDAVPQIIEAQLERGKKTATRLNASASSAPFSLFPLVFQYPSRFPFARVYLHDSPLFSFPFRAFIFFQPLPHGALPVPGLCRGLGGKRVGLAIIPAENREPFASSNYLKFPFDIPRGTGNFIWPWLALSPQWCLSLSYGDEWHIGRSQKISIFESFAIREQFSIVFWKLLITSTKIHTRNYRWTIYIDLHKILFAIYNY